MRVTHPISIIFALAFSASAMSQTVRQSIQGRYDQISKLSIQKDQEGLIKSIRKNATTNFEFIDIMKNSLDIEATVRMNTEQLSKVASFTSNSNKIIGFKMAGDDVICTVKTVYDLYTDYKKLSRIQGVSVSEDVWTKTIVGWKIKKSRSIKESATKNGKLIKA